MNKYLSLLISFIIPLSLFAQDEQADLKNMPAQLTFFYPLGTNGSSTQYKNNLSVNILAGVNGGLDGVEFGGLYNQIQHDVRGVQFAGLGNFVKGNTDGFQFAGLLNASTNISGGQMGGTVNIAENIDGLQISGIFNAGRFTKGPQIGGFMNMAEIIEGPQISGFMNLSDTIDGPQITGFMNTSTQTNGSQIAGFLNLSRNCNGSQIAGFINLTEHVKGVQIAGFMNICDTIEGIPIAPFSVIRNGGYYAFDISANESMFLNFAFQMGVREFYTIYQIGIQPSGERYSLGAGFGIASKLNAKSFLDIQGMVSHINESYSSPFKYTNLLSQLKLNYELDMHKGLKFYAGPSFNVLVSKYKNDLGVIGTDFMPWSIRNYNNDNSKVTIWPGFSLGIKLKT